MGRHSTISESQVAEIAERMAAQGQEPTIRAIRAELGSGSMATILRMFRNWQSHNASGSDASLGLPNPVQKAILDYLKQEIAQRQSHLESMLAEADEAVNITASDVERQNSEIEQLNSLLSEERERSSGLQGRIVQLEADFDQIRDETEKTVALAKKDSERERAEAERLRVDLAKAELRLETNSRMEDELGQLKGELQSERLARHDAERSAAAAQASLHAVLERVSSLESILKDQKLRAAEVVTKLEGDKQKLQAELIDIRKEHLASASKVARLEGILEQANPVGVRQTGVQQ